MSIKVMTLVYGVPFGSVIRKAVALKLADHSDDEGCNIYPSVERIAKATEVHRATVIRVLKAFVKEGLLEVIEPGGGRGRATKYKLNLELINSRAALPFKQSQPATVSAETVAPGHINGRTALPQPSYNRQKERFAQKRLGEKWSSVQPAQRFRISRVTVRDTDESFADYTERMIAEGKLRVTP